MESQTQRRRRLAEEQAARDRSVQDALGAETKATAQQLADTFAYEQEIRRLEGGR